MSYMSCDKYSDVEVSDNSYPKPPKPFNLRILSIYKWMGMIGVRKLIYYTTPKTNQMHKNPALDKIEVPGELELDIAPAITESAVTLGKLFDLIKSGMRTEKERAMILGFREVIYRTRAQENARRKIINTQVLAIKRKRWAYRVAKRMGFDTTAIEQDMLIMLNGLAD